MEIPNSSELKRINILNEGAGTFEHIDLSKNEKIDFIEALYLSLSYAAWVDGVLQDTEKKVFLKIFDTYKDQIPITEHFLFKNALTRQPDWDSFADKLQQLDSNEKLLILKHTYDLYNCDFQYTEQEQEAMEKLIICMTTDGTMHKKIVHWLEINKKIRILSSDIIRNL